MTRLVNRAENWETVYQAFKSINFTAYTYDSVKQSLVDYIREYHSELFNDFIESSELIATIETFAYFCELAAYRFDLNAHESALTVAQRKESVLRLARFLSYNASRNIPARGLLKITSITTSEQVFDSTGTNLANTAVRWNDPIVSNWRERFNLVINRALAREYGNVTPSDRVQISDVLFEQYHLNTINTPTTLPFSVSFGGESYEMELVSSILTENGPEERRPSKGMPFTCLFADDGNGDDSAMTGFFCMTKQGAMQRREITFNGVTPNYSVRVDVDGINNTDVWLNRIDDSGYVFRDPVSNVVIGEWEPVDTSTAFSVVFNTLTNRRMYEVETRDRDRVKLVFGDGEFADVPSGKFELWYRTSEYESDIIIPKSAVSDQNFVFTYPDASGQMQSLRITVSATSSFQNAASSESIERIRRVAPATYYAQDRMVNGKDYNVFPLKNNSIFKLRSMNRTFAGDSKYIPWHDPSGSYENVKMFGDDLSLYYETDESTEVVPDTITPEGIVDTYLVPLLRSSDLTTRFVYERNRPPSALPSTFTATERNNLVRALREIRASAPGTVYATLTEGATPGWTYSTTRPNDSQEGRVLWWFRVTTTSTGGWNIVHITKKIVATSASTRFWNVNTEQNITYDTYRANKDEVIVLGANTTATGTILPAAFPMVIEAAYLIPEGPERGIPRITSVLTAPADLTRDGIPDNLDMDPVFAQYNALTDQNFVYFTRDADGVWTPVSTTVAIIRAYYEQFGWSYTVNADGSVTKRQETSLSSVTGRKVVWLYGAAPNSTIKREVGRTGLNFQWNHYTPRYHLVDPSPTNLIDMFVMTRGYQQAFDLWLSGRLPLKPQPPTPVELRMTYRPLLDNKMISDTVIFQPGKIKTIISAKADPQVRLRLKVIKSPDSLLTNSEIKVQVIEACREFFDLNKWEFGETFYFTELATAVHNQLGSDIDSVVPVPLSGDSSFGDGFQIVAREDEIIYGFVSPNDIDIVTSLDRSTLRQTNA